MGSGRGRAVGGCRRQSWPEVGGACPGAPASRNPQRNEC